MKLDAHVHTTHSGYSTIRPLQRVLRESYNSPEDVYSLAKQRGMDLVCITDHDVISGALELAHRPDVIVGCEVTGEFPGDPVKVHLNVLGLTPESHSEVQRLRGDVRDLLPYLKQQRLFTTLNHIGSSVAGRLTSAHLAALLPWVDALEVINGSRLPIQNRTAAWVAKSTGLRMMAGSDAHHRRGIGETFTEVPGAADRDAFMEGLWAGRAVVGGRHGHWGTLAEDIMRFSGSFYAENLRSAWQQPRSRQTQAMLWGGVFSLPLVPVALVGAYLHFLKEERFNRLLMAELIDSPSRVARVVPDFAA